MKNIKKLFKTHINYKGYKIRLPTLREVSKLNEPIRLKKWFSNGKKRDPIAHEIQERSIDLLYKLGVPEQLPIEELDELIHKLFGGTIK